MRREETTAGTTALVKGSVARGQSPPLGGAVYRIELYDRSFNHYFSLSGKKEPVVITDQLFYCYIHTSYIFTPHPHARGGGVTGAGVHLWTPKN